MLHSRVASNGEVDEPYRPDSDFWYLTGISDPDAVAVLVPGAEAGKRYMLFLSPRDSVQEQWTGERSAPDSAASLFHADKGLPLSEFPKQMEKLFAGARSLFVLDGGDAEFRQRVLSGWRGLSAQATGPLPVSDASPIVHELRLVKDPIEIERIRRAAAISVEAHRKAMALARPGAYESELKARMVGACLEEGAARMAYPPIVGSGPNSVILHYERAERQMQAGEMVVNDTACEYGMYAADVTRSYPVSGRFTPEQRALYGIVLEAQKAGIAKVAPGTAFHEVYDATVAVVVDGLLKLGLMKGDRAEIIRSRSYKAFYPHGSSHWLGLNVHDAGSYQYARTEDRYAKYASAGTKLQPGMVLTVEPGIYFSNESSVAAVWKNIGVRIEDDILVTATGSECLSCAAPRELAEVEAMIQN